MGPPGHVGEQLGPQSGEWSRVTPTKEPSIGVQLGPLARGAKRIMGPGRQLQAIEWAVKAGGDVQTSSQDEGTAIASDGAGGALVTGFFQTTASFGETTLTGPAAFVMRVSGSGTIEWAVKAGGGGNDRGSGIAPDGAGGAFVTGSFYGNGVFGATSLTKTGTGPNNWPDVFVMRVNHLGAIEWAVKAGGELADYGGAIVSDGVGGALVTGHFTGRGNFGGTWLNWGGGSGIDVFVMRVSGSGTIEWTVKAGGANVDQGKSIASDGAGGALVTGLFNGAGLYGTTLLTSSGSFDAFVMRVRSSGTIEWAVKAGGEGNDRGLGIASDGAGGAFVTGSFQGTASFGEITLTGGGMFVMRVSSSGAIEWAIKAVGASGNAISSDGAGGALVTGSFQTTASFGETTLTSGGRADAFVMQVSGSGVIEWAVKAGGLRNDQGSGIASDGAGGALVTGHFGYGTAWFGATSLTLPTSSGDDVFVMRVTPPPSPPPSPPPPSPSPEPPSLPPLPPPSLSPSPLLPPAPPSATATPTSSGTPSPGSTGGAVLVVEAGGTVHVGFGGRLIIR